MTSVGDLGVPYQNSTRQNSACQNAAVTIPQTQNSAMSQFLFVTIPHVKIPLYQYAAAHHLFIAASQVHAGMYIGLGYWTMRIHSGQLFTCQLRMEFTVNQKGGRTLLNEGYTYVLDRESSKKMHMEV